jgi:hypothetical protein
MTTSGVGAGLVGGRGVGDSGVGEGGSGVGVSGVDGGVGVGATLMVVSCIKRDQYDTSSALTDSCVIVYFGLAPTVVSSCLA